jgi:hypothetical protein
MIEIQMQDNLGNWRSYSVVINNSAIIRSAMDQLSRMFPDSRIRAVDERGSIVDIL